MIRFIQMEGIPLKNVNTNRRGKGAGQRQAIGNLCSDLIICFITGEIRFQYTETINERIGMRMYWIQFSKTRAILTQL